MQKQSLKRMLNLFFVLILIFGLGVQTEPASAVLQSPVPVTAIVVNSSLDDPDAANDLKCETAAGNNVCTLRAAIQHANFVASTLGTHISFNIPNDIPFGPTTIYVASALPYLMVAGTTIQGPNLADNSDVVLDGLSGSYSGLEIRANNCAIKNLIIAGFDEYGIIVGCPACTAITGTLITGNMVGNLIPFGEDFLPNGGGILLNNASSSTIGGDTSLDTNVISGNIGIGLSIQGGGSNVVKGNYIGIESNGTTALSNSLGIYIHNSDGNTIGGNIASRRNIISGNEGFGVYLDEGDDNIVMGNYIGTNEMGDAAVPNGDIGIRLGTCWTYSYRNQIGGINPGEGNLISGNTDAGMGVYCNDETAIRGNIIGLNAEQTAALPNEWGILVGSSLNTFIGGAVSGAGNVISGNTKHGIDVGVGSINTSIKGNRIGLNSAGTAFGNGMDGILVHHSTDAPIGGPGLAGNIIAYNGKNGIELELSYAQVGGNSIYNNVMLGIDGWRLESQQGLSPNDLDDDDELQNFPILTSVSFPSAGIVNLQGEIKTLESEQLDIYLYGSAACDPSGYGEGQVYLGTVHTAALSSGWAYFSVDLPLSTPTIYFTATAYGPTNGNSEFSACLAPFSVNLPLVVR